MLDEVKRSMRLSSCALVLCGYFALACLRNYGASVLFIPVVLFVFMPICEWLDGKTKRYRQFTSVANLAWAMFIPVSLRMFELLDAVILLIIYVQAYLLLHKKDTRSYYQLFLMSFFLLLATCSQSPEATIGLALLMYLGSAIWAFLTLQIYAECESSNTSSAVMPVILDGRSESRAENKGIWDSGLMLWASAVAVVALLLTVVFFLTTPRVAAGIFGRSGREDTSVGLDDEVDLTDLDDIEDDSTAVMTVAFPEEPNGTYTGPLFWRCTSLNSYTGSGWRHELLYNTIEPLLIRGLARGPGGGGGLGGRYPDQPPLPQEANYFFHTMAVQQQGNVDVAVTQGSTKKVRQRIFIDEMPPVGLPALTLVSTIRSTGANKKTELSWNRRKKDGTVNLVRDRPNHFEYEAWSQVGEPLPSVLRAAPVNFEDVIGEYNYVVLTDHHMLKPETVELAKEVVGSASTNYDMAKTIEKWLSSSEFMYSLEFPDLPDEYAVDVFIHKNKVGHCELYASAMALMLRSLGVPSRVVSGYRGGEEEENGSIIVRANMAHLWVEVYFIGTGWVAFDPSPPDSGVELGAFQTLARFVSIRALKAKMFWYRNVVGFDKGVHLTRLRELGLSFFGFSSIDSIAVKNTAKLTMLRVSRWVIAAVFVATVSWLFIRSFYRTSKAGHRRKYALTPDQIRAVRLYGRLRRRLAGIGIHFNGKTTEEICAELSARVPGKEGKVGNLFRIYNDTRFGTKSLPGKRYSQYCREVRSLQFVD